MSRMRYRIFVALLAAAAALATVATPATGAPAPANAASCSVRFEQWPTGYTAYVTVTGPAAGWAIPFTTPTGHRLIQAWNANVTISGQNGTASSTSWNGSLGPAQSTMFGLVATRPIGDTQLPTFPTCDITP